MVVSSDTQIEVALRNCYVGVKDYPGLKISEEEYTKDIRNVAQSVISEGDNDVDSLLSDPDLIACAHLDFDPTFKRWVELHLTKGRDSLIIRPEVIGLTGIPDPASVTFYTDGVITNILPLESVPRGQGIRNLLDLLCKWDTFYMVDPAFPWAKATDHGIDAYPTLDTGDATAQSFLSYWENSPEYEFLRYEFMNRFQTILTNPATFGNLVYSKTARSPYRNTRGQWFFTAATTVTLNDWS
ncbi:MAG: hypothetical protein ACTSRE_17380, partial [Promethearchaeota archaeon]